MTEEAPPARPACRHNLTTGMLHSLKEPRRCAGRKRPRATSTAAAEDSTPAAPASPQQHPPCAPVSAGAALPAAPELAPPAMPAAGVADAGATREYVSAVRAHCKLFLARVRVKHPRGSPTFAALAAVLQSSGALSHASFVALASALLSNEPELLGALLELLPCVAAAMHFERHHAACADDAPDSDVLKTAALASTSMRAALRRAAAATPRPVASETAR